MDTLILKDTKCIQFWIERRPLSQLLICITHFHLHSHRCAIVRDEDKVRVVKNLTVGIVQIIQEA